MSLVVPGISETIEVFTFVKQFIKVDFPTFGGPVNTTFTPSLRYLEAPTSSINSSKKRLKSFKFDLNS